MTNERNEVLGPCPFCGGDGEMAETSCFWVVCDACGAEGPTATKEAKAASLWNAATQTQPSPVSRVVELEAAGQALFDVCLANSFDGYLFPRQMRDWRDAQALTGSTPVGDVVEKAKALAALVAAYQSGSNLHGSGDMWEGRIQAWREICAAGDDLLAAVDRLNGEEG